MSKAIALFSGGLDSMLAARLVMEQGIEVTALHFITPFFGYKSKGREQEAAEDFFRKFGVRAMIIDISEEYIAVIRHPRYGYGKNFNPCVDCKIYMMGRAKKLMEELGADFIISGEVLGQRPMSQRKDAMRTVERESGLDGYLLRPLSAKLLKPTIPEVRGLIDRERLLDISGRSRKRQMELAERFGISDYPTPAGGCMLTDPILSKRIEYLLTGDRKVDINDVRLLSLGRHFRLTCGMLYVGRNEADNRGITALVDPADHTLKARDFPGPVSLLRGTPSAEDLLVAARITARYCDAKGVRDVAVTLTSAGAKAEELTVSPIDEETLETLRARY